MGALSALRGCVVLVCMWNYSRILSDVWDANPQPPRCRKSNVDVVIGLCGWGSSSVPCLARSWEGNSESKANSPNQC